MKSSPFLISWVFKTYLQLLVTTGEISTAVAGSLTSKELETACQLSLGRLTSPHRIT